MTVALEFARPGRQLLRRALQRCHVAGGALAAAEGAGPCHGPLGSLWAITSAAGARPRPPEEPSPTAAVAGTATVESSRTESAPSQDPPGRVSHGSRPGNSRASSSPAAAASSFVLLRLGAAGLALGAAGLALAAVEGQAAQDEQRWKRDQATRQATPEKVLQHDLGCRASSLTPNTPAHCEASTLQTYESSRRELRATGKQSPWQAQPFLSPLQSQPLASALGLAHCQDAVAPEARGTKAGEGGGAPLQVPPLPPGFIEELLGALGGDRGRVVQDREELELYAKPWHSYHPISQLPQAVVYPLTTKEVATVVRLCSARGVPITAFGGGTATEGHTTTPSSGITLNLKSMDRVVAFHPEDMDVTVQPGVDWVSLNQFLAPHGLFFPLDPGPGATIGGMCATRCSGSLAVRYGTMRDNVISLQAVLANGDVVRTASRARKSAAGYDLTRLLIGSEGTLGVITEVTLRLQPIPKFSAVALVAFPSVGAAAKCASDTMRQGIQVSRVELLDEVMMGAINRANGFSHEERPTLMFELVGPTSESVQQQLGEVQATAGANGGFRFVFAESEDEKRELWRARKEALWAGYAIRPGTEPLITDVCVPLSRLAECIALTKQDLEASSLPCPLLAHAGDGNMHVLIFFDPGSLEEQAEAHALAKRMTLRALAMGGTCTGEHGLGVGKVQYLEEELGAGAMRAMRGVKAALDPQGIMNPGKVLPPKKDHLCS